MKFFTLTIFCYFLNIKSASAEDIFKIQYGERHSSYTNDELKRRVWDLERAVGQLQKKVFNLENSNSKTDQNNTSVDTWLCTLTRFTKSYSATGASKAIAKFKVIEVCTKSSISNSGCEEENVKCEN